MLIHFNYTFFGHYPDFVAKTLPKQTSSQLTPPQGCACDRLSNKVWNSSCGIRKSQRANM
jgi:hypothetical protein